MGNARYLNFISNYMNKNNVSWSCAVCDVKGKKLYQPKPKPQTQPKPKVKLNIKEVIKKEPQLSKIEKLFKPQEERRQKQLAIRKKTHEKLIEKYKKNQLNPKMRQYVESLNIAIN